MKAGATRAWVLIGVAGSGKTTVGRALAQRLGVEFVDADDFHSEANRAKMAAGQPLTEADRWPWLAALREEIRARWALGQRLVLACSALRREYRRVLSEAGAGVEFVALRVPRAELEARLSQRRGHFFGAALLESQCASWEEAEPGEALVVDGALPIDEIVAQILRATGE